MKNFENLLFTSGFILYTFINSFAQIEEVDNSYFALSDRFGNIYTVGDVSLQKYFDFTNPSALNGDNSCDCGYYRLILEEGSGFFGSSNEAIQKRQVLCQVFTDLSNFIESPLAGSDQFAYIYIRNIDNVILNASSYPLAVASSFSALPVDDFPEEGDVRGLADNELWKVINGGEDPYQGITFPLVTVGGSPNSVQGAFFHGYMTLDMTHNINEFTNWYYDYSVPIGTQQIDLYSVILHEAMHMLGVASYLNYEGSSVANSIGIYYTRYDTHLYRGALPLINQLIPTEPEYGLAHTIFTIPYSTPDCPLSPPVLTMGFPQDNTNCALAIRYEGNPISSTIPVYTPNCFEPGSSLSHLEDMCYPTPNAANNNMYFSMANSISYSQDGIRRQPTPEERGILHDLGYTTNNNFALQDITSQTDYIDLSDRHQIIGYNDGVTDGVFFAYSMQPGQTTIQISNLTANDFDPLASEGSTLEADNIQVIRGEGTITELSSNTWQYSLDAQFNFGVHLLRYVPVASDGRRGNITYVYIMVLDPICLPNGCSLIGNSGFDEIDENQFGVISTCGGILNQGGGGGTLVNLSCWRGIQGGSASLSSSCPGYSALTNWSSTSENWLQIFAGNIGNTPINNQTFSESYIQTRLYSPFINGVNYTYNLMFSIDQAQDRPIITNECNLILASSDIATTDYGLSGNLSEPFPLGFSPENWNVLTEIELNTPLGQWVNLQGTFELPENTEPQNFLLAGLECTAFPINHYISLRLDDLTIYPSQAYGFQLPESICSNQTIDDLQPYAFPHGGVFSGFHVVSTTDAQGNTTYSFDPQGASGNHTVTYTFTDANGCARSVNAGVFVNGSTAAEMSLLPANSSVCIGSGPVSISASGGGSYEWTINDGTPVAETGNTLLYTITEATEFHVNITDTNGCTEQLSTLLTPVVCCDIVVSVDAPSALCSGSTALVTASVISTFTISSVDWIGPGLSGVENVLQMTLPPGPYIVRATDEEGCIGNFQFTIQNLPLPVISIQYEAESCLNEALQVVVSATGGPAPFQGTGTFTIPPGSQTFVVTNQAGCTSSVTEQLIAPEPLVVTLDGPQVLCSGTTGTLMVSATGGQPPYTGTGAFTTMGSPIQVEVTDANNCTYATTYAPLVIPDMNVNLTPVPNCDGLITEVVVSATGGTVPYSGVGEFVLSEGTNSFTVTDANGCSVSDMINLESTQLQYTPPTYLVATGQQLIWSSPDYIFIEDLVIQPGASLIVMNSQGNARLRFAAGKGIIVEPGGSFHASLTTLTNINKCEIWKGIQGLAEGSIRSVTELRSCIVSYARCGFSNSTGFPATYNGGDLRFIGSYFLNNVQDIRLEAYSNISGGLEVPYSNLYPHNIEDCIFRIDDDFLSEMAEPRIFMHRVKGIDIARCDFENTKYDLALTPNVLKTERFLVAVRTLRSNVRVIGRNPETNGGQPMNFIRGFTYGIYSTLAPAGLPSKVRFMDFRCYRGVYAWQLRDLRLYQNTFFDVDPAFPGQPELGPTATTIEVGVTAPLQYGAYLSRKGNYDVQENVFAQGFERPAHGLIVNDAGTQSNRVYNNTVYNARVGFNFLNRNRSYSSATNGGLKFSCNTFDEVSLRDVQVTAQPGITGATRGIAKFQGTSDNPAENDWSSLLFPELEQLTVNANVPGLIYYKNISDDNIVSEECSDNVTIIQTPEENPCLPTIVKNVIEHNYEAHLSGLLLEKSILTALRDGGRTQDVLDTLNILSVNQMIGYLNCLTAISPNLSIEVLLSMIEKEYEVPAHVLVLLLAMNPQAAKDEKVREKLTLRTQPISEQDWHSILTGLAWTSDLEEQMAKVDDLRGITTDYFWSIADSLYEDTLTLAKEQAWVKHLHLRARSWNPELYVSALFDGLSAVAVDSLLTANDWDDLKEVPEIWDAEETKKILEFLQLYRSLLTSDSTCLTAQTIADSLQCHTAADWVQGLLYSYRSDNNDEIVLEAAPELRGSEIRTRKGTAPSCLLVPNPCSTGTMLASLSKGDIASCNTYKTDGSPASLPVLAMGTRQRWFDTSALAPGSYVMRVMFTNGTSETLTFIKQ